VPAPYWTPVPDVIAPRRVLRARLRIKRETIHRLLKALDEAQRERDALAAQLLSGPPSEDPAQAPEDPAQAREDS
jgi:hypothetical protein